VNCGTLLLGIYVGRGEGITRAMPYPEHADARSLFRFFLDVEDNAVLAGTLAIEQLAGRMTQFVGLRNHRATIRHLSQGGNRREQLAQLLVRTRRPGFADALKGPVGVRLGRAGEF
jgi:hypothetical protein